MRVANIYDVNAKTYLFKLARPEDKVFLVIESGIRAHTTAFSREKNIMPSQFSMKVKPPFPPRSITPQLLLEAAASGMAALTANCCHCRDTFGGDLGSN